MRATSFGCPLRSARSPGLNVRHGREADDSGNYRRITVSPPEADVCTECCGLGCGMDGQHAFADAAFPSLITDPRGRTLCHATSKRVNTSARSLTTQQSLDVFPSCREPSPSSRDAPEMRQTPPAERLSLAPEKGNVAATTNRTSSSAGLLTVPRSPRQASAAFRPAGLSPCHQGCGAPRPSRSRRHRRERSCNRAAPGSAQPRARILRLALPGWPA